MIDFRYHLVSIVAVFLALGLGILMGTAVLNDALVKSLRDDIITATERAGVLQKAGKHDEQRREGNEHVGDAGLDNGAG